MTVGELIDLIYACDRNKQVKIFNIERNMDILEVDTEPTRWDPDLQKENPVDEIWFTIGFERES